MLLFSISISISVFMSRSVFLSAVHIYTVAMEHYLFISVLLTVKWKQLYSRECITNGEHVPGPGFFFVFMSTAHDDEAHKKCGVSVQPIQRARR